MDQSLAYVNFIASNDYRKLFPELEYLFKHEDFDLEEAPSVEHAPALLPVVVERATLVIAKRPKAIVKAKVD